MAQKIMTKFNLRVVEYDETGYYIPRYYTNVTVIAENLDEAKKKAYERAPLKSGHSYWSRRINVLSSEDVLVEVEEK